MKKLLTLLLLSVLLNITLLFFRSYVVYTKLESTQTKVTYSEKYFWQKNYKPKMFLNVFYGTNKIHWGTEVKL